MESVEYAVSICLRTTYNGSDCSMGSCTQKVISAIAVCRVTAQAPKPSTPHGCQFWSSMAHELTHIHERVGEALHMACVNDKNADGGGCQEMKCGGKFQENTKIKVQFDFCFGFRLNHCDSPVSMSYFFKVPDKNVTLSGKLTHNDSYEIPGGKFQGFDTTVIVTIEMVRKDTGHIEFGIIGEVRAAIFGEPIFDPKMTVFPPTLIDVVNCTPEERKQSTPHHFSVPPDDQCRLPKNFTLITTPATKSTQFVIKSATYNKSCELGIQQCSTMEMCKRIGNKEFSKNGICVCAPYADLNPVSGKCQMSVTKLVTTTGLPANGTAIPSVTQASTSKNSSLSVAAIAVIGVIGGLLLIVVIVSIIIYIGRRKRAAIYRDRHQLLTTDDDDDVNMVI